MPQPLPQPDCNFEFLGSPDPSFDYERLRSDVSAIVSSIGDRADNVGHDKYLSTARAGLQRDTKSGAEYLIVGPGNPALASPDTLIVLSTPFGKQPRELVVVAEFMWQLGNVLADENGRVPYLLLAGPPNWSSLSSSTKDGLYHGELDGLADETLQLIQRIPVLRNIGLLAGIGFSYAGSLTSAIGCRAGAAGFGMAGMAMASPGDTVKRRAANLFWSFGRETKNRVAAPYKLANPEIFNKANDVGDVEFWIGLISRAPQNLRLMAALAVGNFVNRLHDFGRLHPNVPATVAHGSDDLITPHEPIRARYGELASSLGPNSMVRWLVARGARHPWGHNAVMLGTPVRYGFERMANGV